jgi:hypothetical protein
MKDDDVNGQNFYLFATPSAFPGIGGTSNTTVGGLTAGDSYEFRIRADYTDGTVSEYFGGGYQTAIISAPAVSVTQFISVVDGSTHLKLSWSGEEAGGGVQVEVRGDPYAGPEWHLLLMGDEDHESWPSEFGGSENGWGAPPALGEQGYITDPAVRGDGTYTYRVRYSAPDGEPSAWSGPSSGTVDNFGETSLAHDLQMRASEVNSSGTSFTIAWSEDVPAQSSLSCALFISDGSESSLDRWDAVPGGVQLDNNFAQNDGNSQITQPFTAEVTGLSPGTTYWVTLWTIPSGAAFPDPFPNPTQYLAASGKTTGQLVTPPPSAPLFCPGPRKCPRWMK